MSRATSISFVVPGKPQPKQRPRRGKGGVWYTPKETKQYEKAVRAAAINATIYALAEDGMLRAVPPSRRWPANYGGPVVLDVSLHFPDRRRRDVDNAVKSVLDGVQTHRGKYGLIADDSQIVRATVSKAVDRDNPRAEVTLRMVAGEEAAE